MGKDMPLVGTQLCFVCLCLSSGLCAARLRSGNAAKLVPICNSSQLLNVRVAIF